VTESIVTTVLLKNKNRLSRDSNKCLKAVYKIRKEKLSKG